MTAIALTAVQAVASSIAYDEVRGVAGAVWWLESRPEEGGRVALMCLAGGRSAAEVTPSSADVGSGLHGYGGAAYAVGGGLVWYVDARDGHVRSINHRGGKPVVILQRGDDREWFGDLKVVAGRLLCVRETPDGDELLEVCPDGSWRVLTRTDGFLGSPVAAGGRLAWLRWSREVMPWDSSFLMVAAYRTGVLDGTRQVAGSATESVTQPVWTDDGDLWFVSDRGGWWNLHGWDGHRTRPVTPVSADVAPPQWEAGYASYLPLPGGRVVLTVHEGPRQWLALGYGAETRRLNVPFTSFKPYLAVRDDCLLAIAASPTSPSQLIEIDVQRSGRTRVLAKPSVPYPAASSLLSQPEAVTVTTGARTPITALLYPPTGAADGWCAPLVVRAHPGPTSAMNNRLDWHVQFLTSRGFAVVDVDYRGSSGYGRAFRHSLYGQWGSADVADCAAVAEHLVKCGRAPRGQVFITGASAGGYTALHAVVSHGSVFAGAVARSAIIDPHRWQQTAPRWQRPHARALAGPAGPVTAQAITRPVLLIHGARDQIASVDDVLTLARQLTDQGKPHELLVLGAAGHVLSARHEAARALEAEIDFYRTILAGNPPVR